MSSTNKTANYELSQFVGTDIPSILSDYNGDMRKIDAGIAEVATSAGSSASAVSALAGRVTTAENNITSLNGALEVTNQRSIQNQTAITAVQGVIPSDASTENKLATVGEVSDVADNVRGVDDRVQAIEDVVPSTASSSNKLATIEDINSNIHKNIYPGMYLDPDYPTTGTVATQLKYIADNIWNTLSDNSADMGHIIMTIQVAGTSPNIISNVHLLCDFTTTSQADEFHAIGLGTNLTNPIIVEAVISKTLSRCSLKSYPFGGTAIEYTNNTVNINPNFYK